MPANDNDLTVAPESGAFVDASSASLSTCDTSYVHLFSDRLMHSLYHLCQTFENHSYDLL